MILTIVVAFLSIIGLLVLHEFGHFIVAKKFGIKVEEFGVGYPPRLFGKKIGETIYSINLLPFGAFVRVPQVDGEETSMEEVISFEKKPMRQKVMVLLGGVVSFWIIAAILFSIVFYLGAPQAISDEETNNLVNIKVQVLSVSPDSPAEKAEIKSGDVIREMKIISSAGEEKIEIEKVKQIQDFTGKHKGENIVLTIQRGNKLFEVPIVPRVSHPEDEGSIGIALVRTTDMRYSFWQSPIKGIEATFNMTLAVIDGWKTILSGLIDGKGMPKGVQFVGPVGIVSLSAQAAQVGFAYFLQFIGMIAVYLAVFNILPIPSLDGGRLLFLAIEKIKGSPVNPKIEQNITVAFFGALILLMIFVTIKDIIRIF
jgi:regulator of sigma E protease